MLMWMMMLIADDGDDVGDDVGAVKGEGHFRGWHQARVLVGHLFTAALTPSLPTSNNRQSWNQMLRQKELREGPSP